MKGRTLSLMMGLVIIPATVNAGGFAVLEQSAKRLGSAYAGAGASGEDASEVWYNPAIATRLDDGVNIGIHYIDPSFEFQDPTVTGPSAAALVGSSRLRDDGGTSAILPNLAFTTRLSDQWFSGVTINVPFGLATEYSSSWIGRYQTIDSEITSINVNPFAAYRLDDHWSFGFGISINYTDVSLSRALDIASICAQAVGGVCPNGALPAGGQFDGRVRAEGDDIGYGFNLGALWSPSEDLRVSLAYRSEIDLDLEGEGHFRLPSSLGGLEGLGPLLGGGLGAVLSDSDAKADLKLPDTASLAVHYQLSPALALLADVTWTGWSTLDAIVIEFENPLTPAAEEPLEWEDTLRYSIGAIFNPGGDWVWRAGVSYDETPVPNARLRTPRLPDNDRTWLTVGATAALGPTMDLDIGYSHILINDTRIEWEGVAGETVTGEYESDGNVLSVGLSVRF